MTLLSFIDDVFTIFETNKSSFHDFMSSLSKRFPSMKFKLEILREILAASGSFKYSLRRLILSYIPKKSHHIVKW